MGGMLHDLRFAARLLFKTPGFTAAAVLTLALGVGASTVIFSVINAVLIRSLPFPNADRIVNIWERYPELGPDEYPLSPLDFGDFLHRSQSFETLGIYRSWRFNLTGVDESERINAARVSADVFRLLGVAPAMGRTFEREEDQAGSRVAIVRQSLWRRRLGADPNVVGKAVALDGKSYTIVGVMPDAFTFPLGKERTELWVPIGLNQFEMSNRAFRAFPVIGRLRPGVSAETARTELASISQQLDQSYPDTNKGVVAGVVTLREFLVKDIRPALLILLGAVGLVLAVACANIANLLLARAVSREREIAVRSALGAGFGRIARQLVTESLLLSLIGCAGGLLISILGLRLLSAITTTQIPRIYEITIDGRVLGFSVLISILTGLGVSLAPVLQASRLNLVDAMKEGSTSGGGARRHPIRSILVISQVAFAQILLIAGALLLNSFLRLRSVPPGFQPDHVLTMQISLTGSRYSPDQEVRRFYHELLGQIAAAPEVKAVGAVSDLPLSQSTMSVNFSIEGRPENASEQLTTDLRLISSDYFRAMGIPFLGGRDFGERDGFEAPKVLIINQTMARRYFPNQDAIGKRMTLTIGDPVPREVIGIVGDVKHSGLAGETNAEVYLPYLQLTFNTMNLVVRTEQDPLSFVSAARSSASRVDESQPIARIRTLEDYVADSIARPRFNTILLGVLALLAVIIALTGVYGVTSYSVTQRTREIGIRMALGARKERVLALVVGRAMRVAIIGELIGLGGALVLTRLLAAQLFGITATDPDTFAVVFLALSGAVFAASYFPARRASRVDPIVALRYE